MRGKRKILARLLTGVTMLAMLVMPVFASERSARESCGLLAVFNGNEVGALHMAVCVDEGEDAYVYTGIRPIDAQKGVFVSVLNGENINELYDLTEDTAYSQIPGVYRFVLGEGYGGGSKPDVFPKAGKVRSGDTVYFVKLERESLSQGGAAFSTERATVSSVSKGILHTKENMESKTQSGDMQAVFNDSGEMVGLWKKGTVYSVLTKSTGVPDWLIYALVGGICGAIGGAIRASKKKKKESQGTPNGYNASTNTAPVSDMDSEETTLNYDPNWNSGDSGFQLVCHGGYQDGRTYPITRDGVTIGRSVDNTIRYPEDTPGVSRHHCKLYFEGGRLILLDCGSSGGTFMQRAGRLSPMVPTPVRQGDIFFLGERKNGFQITFR